MRWQLFIALILVACSPAPAVAPVFTLAPTVVPHTPGPSRLTMTAPPTVTISPTRAATVAPVPSATATEAVSTPEATPCPHPSPAASAPVTFAWPTDARYVSGLEFDPPAHLGLDLFARCMRRRREW